MEHGVISHEIIGSFYTAYDRLGYGYLEAVYRGAMVVELRSRGLRVRAEVPVDVWYAGVVVGSYRADLVVEDAIVVELKATHTLDPSARRQLLNYLRCTDLEVGLLLHFGQQPRVMRVFHRGNRGRRSS